MALPLQILPQEETLGSRLGTALGTGIGTGLQNLAHMKMQELSKRNIAQGLSTLGYKPEEAQALSGLDTNTLNTIIKQKLQEPQQQAYAEALNAILGTGAPEQAITPSTTLSAQKPSTLGTAQPAEEKRAIGLPSLKGLTERQATQLAKLSASERKLQHEKEKASKKELADLRKEQRIEQEDINKETKEFYTDTLKEVRAAKENDLRLDRMTQLVNSGKLTPSLLASLSNTIQEGLFGPHGPKFDLTAFKSPESQEFEKLSNDFLKSAKEIFGARLTNFDVSAFLKTVPTLVQTDEGKKRVIQNLKVFNDAVKLRAQAMDDLIKENKGKRPRNLQGLVEEKIAPQLDQLSEVFKAGYEATQPTVEKPPLITYGQNTFPYFKVNL